MLAFILCACFISDVENDIKKIALEDVEYTRYLKIQSIEEASVASFVLNTVSNKRLIITPVVVNDNLIRFDLRDYGIKPDNYSKLGKDVYTKDSEFLKKITKSTNPVMRADYFIIKAMPATNLLTDVKDLESFRKRHLYDSNAVKFGDAAIVSNGNVAKNSVYIKRIPTALGSVWEMRISKNEVYLTNILSEDYDFLQLIATNPNGLLSYFIADNKGKACDYVDPNIATDSKSEDSLVRVSKSCVICHIKGVLSFEDDIRKLLKKDGELRGKKDDVARVTELFSGNLDSTIQREQGNYEVALLKATGMRLGNFNRSFANIWQQYYRDLTLEEAAKDFDMDLDSFRRYCQKSGDFHLVNLVVNGKISRKRLDQVLKR